MIAPQQPVNRYAPEFVLAGRLPYLVPQRPPVNAPTTATPVNTPHFNHINVVADVPTRTATPPGATASMASTPAVTTAAASSGSTAPIAALASPGGAGAGSGGSGCSTCQQRAQQAANVIKAHPVAAIVLGAFGLWLVLR